MGDQTAAICMIKEIVLPKQSSKGSTDGTAPVGYQVAVQRNTLINPSTNVRTTQCLLFGPVGDHTCPYNNTQGLTRDAVVTLSDCYLQGYLFGFNTEPTFADANKFYPLIFDLFIARSDDIDNDRVYLSSRVFMVDVANPIKFELEDFENLWVPKDYNIYVSILLHPLNLVSVDTYHWRFSCIARLDD